MVKVIETTWLTARGSIFFYLEICDNNADFFFDQNFDEYIIFSLLPYPPEHRELIVSAAIHKLFNETDLDVPPTPILAEIDQLPYSTLHQILGETRIARNPRARATTRVNTKHIEISTVESQSNAGFLTDRRCMLAHHQMDVISFASLGKNIFFSNY